MLRTVRVERLPKVEGITPVRLFMDTSRNFSLWSRPSSRGRWPVSLLFWNIKLSSLRQWDRLIGIVPLIMFPTRIICWRLVRWPSSEGIWPKKELFERSRVLREVRLESWGGIIPKSPRLLRCSDWTFVVLLVQLTQTKYSENNLYSTQTQHFGDQTPRIWKISVLFQCQSQYPLPFSHYSKQKFEKRGWKALRRNENASLFFNLCINWRMQQMKYAATTSFNGLMFWAHLDCVLIMFAGTLVWWQKSLSS